MRKTAFSAIYATTVLLGVGCNQNPFPENSNLQSEKPPPQKPVEAPFSIVVPDLIEFKEGRKAEISIAARVPAPGRPIVNFVGLPSAAAYDPVRSVIVWAPDYAVVERAANDNIGSKVIPVKILLRSSDDTVTTYQRDVIFMVHDSPRPIQFSGLADSTLIEGQAFSAVIDVVDPDEKSQTAATAYGLMCKGAPAGTTITQDPTNPHRFRVQYTPLYSDVKINDYYDGGDRAHFRNVPVEFVAIAPGGKSFTQRVTWRLQDSRQLPRISGPNIVTQGPEVNFIVRAEDPNGEVPPVAELISDGAALGIRSIARQTTAGSPVRAPSTAAMIEWRNIPQTAFGRDHTIQIRFCVNRAGTTEVDYCDVQNVRVQLQTTVHPAPTIDRTRWPLGVTRRLRANETRSVAIPVPATDGTAPVVQIFPEHMRGQITWADGGLTLSPQTVGFKQFDLVATSAFGVTQKESFVYDVLPATWSKTLILAESMRTGEIGVVLQAFPGAQVIDPRSDEVSDRTLALRENLYVGTTALSDANSVARVELIASKIKNVILSSPLLKLFTGALKEELDEQRVSLRFRLQELMAPVPLDTLQAEVELGSVVASPVGVIKLAGTTTTESASPLSVQLSVGSRCVQEISAQSPSSATRVPLVVSCDRRRTDGGRLIVAGLEWAEWSPQNATDAELPVEWLRGLVGP